MTCLRNRKSASCLRQVANFLKLQLVFCKVFPNPSLKTFPAHFARKAAVLPGHLFPVVEARLNGRMISIWIRAVLKMSDWSDLSWKQTAGNTQILHQQQAEPARDRRRGSSCSAAAACRGGGVWWEERCLCAPLSGRGWWEEEEEGSVSVDGGLGGMWESNPMCSERGVELLALNLTMRVRRWFKFSLQLHWEQSGPSCCCSYLYQGHTLHIFITLGMVGIWWSTSVGQLRGTQHFIFTLRTRLSDFTAGHAQKSHTREEIYVFSFTFYVEMLKFLCLTFTKLFKLMTWAAVKRTAFCILLFEVIWSVWGKFSPNQHLFINLTE